MLKIDKKYAKKYVGDKTLKTELISPFKTLRAYIFNEVDGVSTTMIVTTPMAEEYYETEIENTLRLTILERKDYFCMSMSEVVTLMAWIYQQAM